MASEGKLEAVGKLLDAGTPIDSRDSEGCSALHWACDRGSMEVDLSVFHHLPYCGHIRQGYVLVSETALLTCSEEMQRNNKLVFNIHSLASSCVLIRRTKGITSSKWANRKERGRNRIFKRGQENAWIAGILVVRLWRGNPDQAPKLAVCYNEMINVTAVRGIFKHTQHICRWLSYCWGGEQRLA